MNLRPPNLWGDALTAVLPPLPTQPKMTTRNHQASQGNDKIRTHSIGIERHQTVPKSGSVSDMNINEKILSVYNLLYWIRETFKVTEFVLKHRIRANGE